MRTHNRYVSLNVRYSRESRQENVKVALLYGVMEQSHPLGQHIQIMMYIHVHDEAYLSKGLLSFLPRLSGCPAPEYPEPDRGLFRFTSPLAYGRQMDTKKQRIPRPRFIFHISRHFIFSEDDYLQIA